MLRLCKSNIIFPCIGASVIRPSVRHMSLPKVPGGIQPILLHHLHSWCGRNLVRVWKKKEHYFYVHPSSVHLFVTLSRAKPLRELQPSLALQLPLFGKRELILVLFLCLFDLCLFGFVCFLFLLVSGKG